MNHAHHWVIDTPNGALSQGKCRHCGAEQLFRNSEQDTVLSVDRNRHYREGKPRQEAERAS